MRRCNGHTVLISCESPNDLEPLENTIPIWEDFLVAHRFDCITSQQLLI